MAAAAGVVLAAAACSSNDSGAEPTTTTTTTTDGVNCEAARIVAVGNETVGDILGQGFVPISSSLTPESTQAAIDESIPPMADALLELMPPLNRAVADLRSSLPTKVRSDVDGYLEFIQAYARAAAAIRDVAGFEATLDLENSTQGDAFNTALLSVDEVLQAECGITLLIDRPAPIGPSAE